LDAASTALCIAAEAAVQFTTAAGGAGVGAILVVGGPKVLHDVEGAGQHQGWERALFSSRGALSGPGPGVLRRRRVDPVVRLRSRREHLFDLGLVPRLGQLAGRAALRKNQAHVFRQDGVDEVCQLLAAIRSVPRGRPVGHDDDQRLERDLGRQLADPVLRALVRIEKLVPCNGAQNAALGSGLAGSEGARRRLGTLSVWIAIDFVDRVLNLGVDLVVPGHRVAANHGGGDGREQWLLDQHRGSEREWHFLLEEEETKQNRFVVGRVLSAAATAGLAARVSGQWVAGGGRDSTSRRRRERAANGVLPPPWLAGPAGGDFVDECLLATIQTRPNRSKNGVPLGRGKRVKTGGGLFVLGSGPVQPKGGVFGDHQPVSFGAGTRNIHPAFHFRG